MAAVSKYGLTILVCIGVQLGCCIACVSVDSQVTEWPRDQYV